MEAKIKGYWTQPHFKGLSLIDSFNYMCIKFEIDTTYIFLGIESNLDK